MLKILYKDAQKERINEKKNRERKTIACGFPDAEHSINILMYRAEYKQKGSMQTAKIILLINKKNPSFKRRLY